MTRHLGLIATVPWRARSFNLTLRSLLPQLNQLWSLHVFFDGFERDDDAVHETLALLEPVNLLTYSTGSQLSGGAWARLSNLLKFRSDSGLDNVLVFDDDMLYPEDYVGYMLASQDRLGGVVALSGRKAAADAGYTSYTTARLSDVCLAEAHLGTSCFPFNSIVGVERDPLALAHLHTWTSEIFLGYWWWKHGLNATSPKGGIVTKPILPEAKDPRCIFAQHGRDQQDELRRTIRKLSGYPF